MMTVERRTQGAGSAGSSQGRSSWTGKSEAPAAPDMMSDVLAFSKGSLHSSDRAVQPAGNPDGGDAWILSVSDLCPGQRNRIRSSWTWPERPGLVIMETGHRMFSACGMLYEAGLRGGAI